MIEPRWKKLGWPRNYDRLVWRPLKQFREIGTEKAHREAMKLRYRYMLNDVWFFAYFILGFFEKYPTHLGNPFHAELCGIINEIDPKHWTQDYAFFLPRGHLKSCLITVAHTIQLILKYPDIRVAIVSGKDREAQNQFGKIKLALETNSLLKEYFPHILYKNPKDESDRWMARALKVKQRTDRLFYEGEPTVAAYSIDGLDTGPHYDLVIFDDGVNLENSESPTVIENTDKAFRALLLNLEPSCPRVLVGTFYDFADFHCQTYRTWQDERRRGQGHVINVYLRKLKYEENAEQSILKGCKTGDYIFPGKWNDLAVARFRHKQGLTPKQFASQMLMSPISPGETRFEVEWLRYYEQIGVPEKRPEADFYRFTTYGKEFDGRWSERRELFLPLHKCMTIDLAVSEKPGSDFTVLNIAGVAPNDDWFILDYLREHISGVRFIEKFIAMLQKHMPVTAIGIEAENIAKAYREFILLALEKAGLNVPVYWLKQPRGAKEGRIEGELAGRLKNSKIFISESMSDAEDEVARFGTAGGTDDILDTWANIAKVRSLPSLPIDETVEERKRRELRELYLHNIPGMVHHDSREEELMNEDVIERELLPSGLNFMEW